MPDPNLAGMSKRSHQSTQADRYWITTVDGARLREARIARGLSRRELVDEAGVSLGTLGRLERERTPSCHRATLYRIAATLATDPQSLISALTRECAFDTQPREGRAAPDSSWQCSRSFAAQPDQVAVARAFLGRVLHGCPMIYEAQLICSELITNAVRHSLSARPGGKVTVRTEVRECEYIWLEVEDQGGIWNERHSGEEGGRGLEVVAALSDYWDIRGDDSRRMVYARLDWPGFNN